MDIAGVGSLVKISEMESSQEDKMDLTQEIVDYKADEHGVVKGSQYNNYKSRREQSKGSIGEEDQEEKK